MMSAPYSGFGDDLFFDMEFTTPSDAQLFVPQNQLQSSRTQQFQTSRKRAPIKKWTKEEDLTLRQGVLKYINKGEPIDYEQIALLILGRSVKQAKERWKNSLNPTIKKGEWSDEELLKLLDLIISKAQNWTEIQKELRNRSMHCIKSKGRKLLGETLSKRLLKKCSGNKKKKEKDFNQTEEALMLQVHLDHMNNHHLQLLNKTASNDEMSNLDVFEFCCDEDLENMLEEVCMALKTGRPTAVLDRKLLAICGCRVCRVRKEHLDRNKSQDFKISWTQTKAKVLKLRLLRELKNKGRSNSTSMKGLKKEMSHDEKSDSTFGTEEKIESKVPLQMKKEENFDEFFPILDSFADQDLFIPDTILEEEEKGSIDSAELDESFPEQEYTFVDAIDAAPLQTAPVEKDLEYFVGEQGLLEPLPELEGVSDPLLGDFLDFNMAEDFEIPPTITQQSRREEVNHEVKLGSTRKRDDFVELLDEEQDFDFLGEPTNQLRRVDYELDLDSQHTFERIVHNTLNIGNGSGKSEDDPEVSGAKEIFTMVRNYSRTSCSKNSLARQVIQLFSEFLTEKQLCLLQNNMKKHNVEWLNPTVCSMLDKLQFSPEKTDIRYTQSFLCPDETKVSVGFDPFRPVGAYVLDFVSKMILDVDTPSKEIARGSMLNRHGWHFVVNRLEGILRVYYLIPKLLKTGKAWSYIKFYRVDGSMGVFLCLYTVINPKKMICKVEFQDVSDKMYDILMLPDTY